jgi:hypothetical protein
MIEHRLHQHRQELLAWYGPESAPVLALPPIPLDHP